MNWTKADRGKDQIYGESIYTSRFEIFGNYLINKNLSLYFSFNDHYQNSVYGLNYFNANQTVGFGQFIWTNSFKKHNLLVGLAYRYTYYDDDTTATYNEKLFSNLPSNTHLPGIFFQDELKFNEYQSLLFGLRYDYNSLHGDIVTPRINYKLNNVDKSTILRLSFGSGYRVAQIFTEDHAALTGARDVVFLEELNPERSWNFNANLLKKLYFKQGALLDIDFSIFYTKFSNKIIPKYDLDPTKIIYSNLVGTSTNQGASLNLNLLIQNGIRLNLGTTFIDSFIKEENFKSTPFLTERYQGVLKIEKNGLTLESF